MESGYIDTIDQYLLNNLEAEEKKAFEKLIQSSTEAKTTFEQRKEMLEYIQLMAQQTKKKQIASIQVKEEDFIFEDEINASKHRSISPFAYLALAASIVFLLGMAFIFSNYNSTNYNALADKYYETYTIPQSRNSGSSTVKSDKERAKEAYNNKTYPKAIALLATFEDDIELSLLLGIAYYETNQFENALQQFELLKNSNNILYKNEVLWYASICYLQLNKPDMAKSDLKTIFNDKRAGKKIRQSAESLLLEL